MDFVDIDFDGYLDLQVNGLGLNTINSTSSFWLFNPQTGLFEESQEFSSFDELSIDKDKREITSWSASVGYDKSSQSSTYKVVDHHLVLVAEERSYEDEHERQELLNGEMTVVSRSGTRSIRDSVGKSTGADLVIVTSEEWLFDSLRVVSEIRERRYFGQESDSLQRKLIELQTEWGTFRLEQKTTFEYSRTSDGAISVDETVQKVINGDWALQSHTKHGIR